MSGTSFQKVKAGRRKGHPCASNGLSVQMLTCVGPGTQGSSMVWAAVQAALPIGPYDPANPWSLRYWRHFPPHWDKNSTLTMLPGWAPGHKQHRPFIVIYYNSQISPLLWSTQNSPTTKETKVRCQRCNPFPSALCKHTTSLTGLADRSWVHRQVMSSPVSTLAKALHVRSKDVFLEAST